jgi:hypothetical protein
LRRGIDNADVPGQRRREQRREQRARGSAIRACDAEHVQQEEREQAADGSRTEGVEVQLTFGNQPARHTGNGERDEQQNECAFDARPEGSARTGRPTARRAPDIRFVMAETITDLPARVRAG